MGNESSSSSSSSRRKKVINKKLREKLLSIRNLINFNYNKMCVVEC